MAYRPPFQAHTVSPSYSTGLIINLNSARMPTCPAAKNSARVTSSMRARIVRSASATVR